MNRKVIFTILFFIVFLLLGAVIIAVIMKINAPSSVDTNNTSTVSDNTTTTETPTNTIETKRKADLKLVKDGTGVYDLVIFNDNLDVESLQLRFTSTATFDQFIPNSIFDVALQNEINSDGEINVSLGKLINRGKENDQVTRDGGFIIGSFILKDGSSGKLTLDSGAKVSIVIDAQGARNLNEYSINLP
jgi:hypothetical protein